MLITNPKVTVFYHDVNRMLMNVEKGARLCYKTEGNMGDTPNYDFIRKRIDTGHLSTIEHEKITVHVVCDRGISHEIVRHRIAAYCLSGDTQILRFNQNRGHLTIKELYDRQQNGQLRGRNKLMTLRSMNSKGILVPNKFVDVYQSGIKEVYRITTSLGYSIKTSLEHIFFNAQGEKRLEELNVGDKVFVNGVPWNKGLTEEEDSRVKNQAEALRNNHHNNGFGENNTMWKGDNIESDSGKRLRFTKLPKECCELCGSKDKLENHHRDGDINNWDESNKMTLCASCHTLVHKGFNVKKVVEDEIVSIDYIGKEMTYDLEMKAPHHNFVANGFIVHNSQESTRYCNYSNDKFGNQITVVKPLFFKDAAELEQREVFSDIELDKYSTWCEACQIAEKRYFKLLDIGATPQEARSVLPTSLKTEIIMTYNLREWRHFFTLRCAKEAHPQMRQIAIPLLKEFTARMPIIFRDIPWDSNFEEENFANLAEIVYEDE